MHVVRTLLCMRDVDVIVVEAHICARCFLQRTTSDVRHKVNSPPTEPSASGASASLCDAVSEVAAEDSVGLPSCPHDAC